MHDTVETWLKDFTRAIAALPEDQRRDIVSEVRGHLQDRLEAGLTPDQALHGFGAPDLYARPFIEQHVVSHALQSRGTIAMIKAVLALAGRGLAAMLSLLIVSLCTLLGLAIAVLFLIDLFGSNGRIGEWAYAASGTTFSFWINDKPHPGAHIFHLGLWSVPIVLGVLALLWMTARFSLRLTLKALQGMSAPSPSRNSAA